MAPTNTTVLRTAGAVTITTIVAATVRFALRLPSTRRGRVTVRAVERVNGQRKYRLDVVHGRKTGWRYVTEKTWLATPIGATI